MRGIRDQPFLADSVELKVDARRVDEEILIDVSVNNVNAGHHIPTDSPLRHMLLVVEARDRSGVELEMLTGPRLHNALYDGLTPPVVHDGIGDNRVKHRKQKMPGQ